MSLALCGSLAAGLTLAASDVAADDDPTAGMRERDHTVQLRFEPGYATLTVRRTVYNDRDRRDEAVSDILTPALSVVTGLRLRGRHGWHAGQLHRAEDARDRYDALTVMDPARDPVDRGAALLGWGTADGPVLRIFPVDPGRSRTVEYTLDMPAEWIEGRWVIDLDDSLTALSIRSADPRDRLYLDDKPVPHDRRVLLSDDEDSDYSYYYYHQLALRPHAQPAVALELASDGTGGDRAFVHWRVTVGRRLSQIPRAAHVVVALDLSRSLAKDVDESQRRAALAYLTHLRDPSLAIKVTLLGFDRRIHRLGDRWTSVDQAIRALRKATLEPANGSDIDLALRTAGQLLASAPAGAPRRVLVLTDFMTASSRSLAEHEAAADTTAAIVHLAEVKDDAPHLARDDDHPWAPVAARTHGVVWSAAARSDEDAEDRAAARALFEEWARPLRIDHLRLDLGQPHAASIAPSLAENEGSEDLRFMPRTVDAMTVRGVTWNTPFVRTAPRSPSLTRRWSALIHASHLSPELNPDERLHLALRGGAVTPETSYLAVEPGAGPSRAGLPPPRAEHTGLMGKGGGGGTGTGYGRGAGAGFGGRLDRQGWLEDELAILWQRCGGAGHGATLELETTYEELVDFALTTPTASDPARLTCMREATWSLWLPATDFVDPRARWTVVLRPA
jgi:hypothetical protein